METVLTHAKTVQFTQGCGWTMFSMVKGKRNGLTEAHSSAITKKAKKMGLARTHGLKAINTAESGKKT